MAARINNDICVDSAIRALARGEFVVVVDDEDRENEGDLVLAAEHVTPEKVCSCCSTLPVFLCAAIAENRAKELQLDLMVENNIVNQRRRPRESVSGWPIQSVAPIILPAPVTSCRSWPETGGVLKRAGHT